MGKGVPDGGSFVSAQFSIPYVVAACILDGALGPAQLTERRMADPAVMALAKKVTVQPDDDLNKMYPDKTASRMEITMKNGTNAWRSRWTSPRAIPAIPWRPETSREKVRFFAGSRDRKKTDRVIDAVMGMEKVEKHQGAGFPDIDTRACNRYK